MKKLGLGGEAYFQVAGNALANTITANDAGNSLSGNDGNDTLRGGAGNDTLDGGRGRDNIYGGTGNDEVNGGDADDNIRGENGADTMNGGGGNDVITGGNGKDILTGGLGNDRFVFTAVKQSAGSTVDEVSDFTVDPEQVDLRRSHRRLGHRRHGRVHRQSGLHLHRQAAFTAEGQIRVVQRDADTLISFNTKGVSGAEMQVLLRNFTATDLADIDFIL